MLPSKMHVVVTLRIRRRNLGVLFSASICATDGRIIVARDPVSALGNRTHGSAIPVSTP